MCNIVHTCIKKYTVAVQYSCKFCTARVFLFLADHAAIQFTNINKIQRYLGARYLCADEANGLLVPYVPLPVRHGAAKGTPRKRSTVASGGASDSESVVLVSWRNMKTRSALHHPFRGHAANLRPHRRVRHEKPFCRGIFRSGASELGSSPPWARSIHLA